LTKHLDGLVMLEVEIHNLDYSRSRGGPKESREATTSPRLFTSPRICTPLISGAVHAITESGFSLLGKVGRPNNNICLLEGGASHQGIWIFSTRKCLKTKK